MISVLVCSVKPGLLNQLKNSITNTIGVEHEVLAYDNRESNKGICEVYNLLAEKARFENFCFVHEDVLFSSYDWGKTLIDHFIKDNYDVIGVAGSKYKSKMFSGWFTGQKPFDCTNYLHQFPNGIEKTRLQPNSHKLLEEVVCLDGVFICCKKEVWKNNRFDEQHLKGFHFYDIDFSIRAAKKYRVGVTYNLEITHITGGGDFGNKWADIAINYHLRQTENLPFSKEFTSDAAIEKKIAGATLDVLKNHSISLSKKLKWIKSQDLHLYPELYYPTCKFLFYKPLKLKYLHNIIKSK